jgi:Uma2 family endonuclease
MITFPRRATKNSGIIKKTPEEITMQNFHYYQGRFFIRRFCGKSSRSEVVGGWSTDRKKWHHSETWQNSVKAGLLLGGLPKSSGQSGQAYISVSCRTNKQGRSPDVAYLTPELVAQFGNEATFPQSFPLCAEIVSPTDIAENVLLKAQEYLESGGEEVWLVFPESRWVMVITENQGLMFTTGQVVCTQKVLQGFTVAVNDLLA